MEGELIFNFEWLLTPSGPLRGESRTLGSRVTVFGSSGMPSSFAWLLTQSRREPPPPPPPPRANYEGARSLGTQSCPARTKRASRRNKRDDDDSNVYVACVCVCVSVQQRANGRRKKQKKCRRVRHQVP